MSESLDFEQYCASERFLENGWWPVHLRWLLGAGLVLLAPPAWFAGVRTDAAAGLAALGLGLLAANAGLARRLRRVRTQPDIAASAARVRASAGIQAAADLAVLAAAAWLTGGPASPVPALGLLVVLTAGLLVSRTAALALALLGVALQGALLWLPAPPGAAGLPPTAAAWLPLLLLALGLVTAALLAGRIGTLLAFRESTLTQLGRVLADKTAELDQANARLRDLDRLRVDQVRRVSHELRSPLATVRNCLLRAAQLAPAPPEAADMVARACRRTQGLLEFINDVLALARVESGRFEREETEPVDLAAVLEQAAELLKGRAADKKLQLSLDLRRPVPALAAAPQYLEQLVVNLLTNAVKYTPPGGRVAAAVRAEGGHVVLEVVDTGIGMSADQQAHLFEQFFRTPEARRMDPNGTGLGMTLVKQVADRYNAVLSVDSSPGQGTRFVLRFPAPATPQGA